MIVGNGQLAQVFMDSDTTEHVIFASGVPNSNCTDSKEFDREKNLLVETLKNNSAKKFVYFSSCALSALDYPKNAYYNHKANMEALIKKYSNNYSIFRIPQLFGNPILHKTLINFIYESIHDSHKFRVYDEAYRYVIEINDVRTLIEAYLKYHDGCMTVDIANPYRYKVLDIVHIFESLLNKTARYEIVRRDDQYILDLSSMQQFIKERNIHLEFGQDYLMKKLAQKIGWQDRCKVDPISRTVV